MQPQIPAVFLIVGIICAAIMYCNMMRAIEIKSLRRELSSMITSNPTSNRDGISMELLNEQIYDMVKQKFNNYLNDVFIEEGTMDAQTAVLDNVYAEDDQTPMSRNNINYADKLLGAHVDEVVAESIAVENFFTRLGLITNANSPDLILQSNMRPGDCFGYKNNKAMFTISLAKSIHIEAIELQHISKIMSPLKSTDSAPRFFTVYAIYSNNEEDYLGDYEFENRFPYQQYKIDAIFPVQRIRFHFLGNHGHPNFTCIYRIAVYGVPE